MSWSLTTTGYAPEIRETFDAYQKSCAGYGMIEAEQQDIAGVRDAAVGFAEKYGRVCVSASGHWNTYGAEDPRNEFGRAYLSIEKALPVAGSAPVADPTPDTGESNF